MTIDRNSRQSRLVCSACSIILVSHNRAHVSLVKLTRGRNWVNRTGSSHKKMFTFSDLGRRFLRWWVWWVITITLWGSRTRHACPSVPSFHAERAMDACRYFRTAVNWSKSAPSSCSEAVLVAPKIILAPQLQHDHAALILPSALFSFYVPCSWRLQRRLKILHALFVIA